MCARIQDTKKEIKKESAGLSPAETKDSCRLADALDFLHRWPCIYIYINLYWWIHIYICAGVCLLQLCKATSYDVFCLPDTQIRAHRYMVYSIHVRMFVVRSSKPSNKPLWSAKPSWRIDFLGGKHLANAGGWVDSGLGKERVESLEKHLAYNVERWKELPPGSVKNIFSVI